MSLYISISSRTIRIKAECGVGEGRVLGVVGEAVAHRVHAADVIQAGCPPGPMAQVDTAPLARQLAVGVVPGFLVSVGRSVGVVHTSTGTQTVCAPLPLHSVVVVLKAHPPVLTGSVKSGGLPVGLA
jgi:hypothetical protein